jgi:glyceraldehyde 3-phosphate dehydrogenase
MKNKHNILINGFGRIGKILFRHLMHQPEFTGNVIINGVSDMQTLERQIKYDSVHGIFPLELIERGEHMECLGRKIILRNARVIEDLALGHVDLVLECSGHYKARKDFERFLALGAKKIIISAPCPEADKTIIFGVNHDTLKTNDLIISSGSCTTNCLAPICDVLVSSVGINKGYMTTIHSYTNDQRLLDGNHPDPRRSRAANLSIVPTTTGAAKSIGQIIPMLQGKLDGSALRVPTPNVSMIDFSFIAMQNTTTEAINSIFEIAAKTNYKNIIEISPTPLVSVDFNGNKNSAIFDPFETRVIDGNMVRVVAWYDNEVAFAARMLDIARLV